MIRRLILAAALCLAAASAFAGGTYNPPTPGSIGGMLIDGSNATSPVTFPGIVSGTAYRIGLSNAISFPTFDSGTAGDTLAIGPGALGGAPPAGAAYHAVAIGAGALGGSLTTAAINNTAVGYTGLTANTSGVNNTSLGAVALSSNTTGGSNTGLGSNAGRFISTGSNNTAVGKQAILGVTGSRITGANNTAVGSTSGLAMITTANANTLMGFASGSAITTGAANTIIGSSVGSATLTTGSNNVLIGTTSGIDTAAAGTSNTIQIGAGSTAILGVTGAGTPTTSILTVAGQQVNPQLTTGTNADTVCMEAGGRLLIQAAACTISSMRFKNLIGDYKVGGALGTIRGLEPIVFTMKEGEKRNPDPNYGNTQIGLSAENVAAIEPRCAIYEDDGVTPKSYRQECLIAVLVAGMKAQQAEIAALKARVR